MNELLNRVVEAIDVMASLAIMLFVFERRRMSDAGITRCGLVTETVSGYPDRPFGILVGDRHDGAVRRLPCFQRQPRV